MDSRCALTDYQRDGKGRFKRAARYPSRLHAAALGLGVLIGTAMTLAFVALGNQYPETEVIASSSVVQAPVEGIPGGVILDDGTWVSYEGLTNVLAPEVFEPWLTEQTVLKCQEDEIILGVGDYHGESNLWDEYTCIPLDDLVEIHPYSQDLYTVEPGDTMWDLSQDMGISLTQLEDLNGGSTSRDWNILQVGEVLILG